MSEYISLLTVRDGADRDALCGAIRTACAGEQVVIEPMLPGGRNAGDVLVRRRLAAGARPDLALPAAFAAMIESADGAQYEITASGGVSPGRGIYRTALFHAFRHPRDPRRSAFAAETIAMARRVPTIRGWALGAVTRAWGRFAWTHIWEQTFDQLEGLTETYMRHPCHWGQVDRWFDPEHPDWLIDPGLCHAFCRSEALPSLKGPSA
jgi:hypothetical protein